jgi:hypothetical protein
MTMTRVRRSIEHLVVAMMCSTASTEVKEEEEEEEEVRLQGLQPL